MARILSLADGTVTLLPRGLPEAASVRVTLAAEPRSSRAPLPGVVRGEYLLSDEYARELGDSLERLASMALARKLRSPSPIDASEAAMIVGLAGVPNTRAGRMLTDRILTASAEELGKGGIIGSISGAVSSAVSAASGAVKGVSKVVSGIQKTVDSGLRAAAPLLKNIPVIGPAAASAATIVANQGDLLAGSSFKGLANAAMHPANTFARLTGGALGDVASITGAAAQGVIEAPGTIASDIGMAGEWLKAKTAPLLGGIGGYFGGGAGGGVGMFQDILAGGRNLVNRFGSSFASTVESANPRLHGELTSIFQGLGDYSSFGHVFDGWSMQMKNAPLGTSVVGKLNGNLYSMIKDEFGNVGVTQTPVENAPAATQSLPEGQLATPQTLAGLGVGLPAAGSGYGPGYSGSAAGIPTSPAGLSLPGGPINPATDSGSQAMLAQAAAAAGGKAKAPSAILAGMPLWAVAGLGVVALAALFGPGKGPMVSMGQGWSRPARRSRRRR